MYKLFHLTPQKNLESILIHGLCPFFKSGLSRKQDHFRLKRELGNIVWLTNDPKYIIENQAGHPWAKKNNLQILTINIDAYREKLRARIVWCYEVPKVSDHEFYVMETIKPEDIIKIESWESVLK